ncbi:phage major tail tube protein [Chromobacterium subtsugae]|uniref:phage major tail tube protein n=1 Tax=Chromobacterium subtsugae TaxID=251747 RepID=UPI0007F9385F|nr:phage major tail tube protein [Chromobacterium subtsugae]OBU84532.1 major tail tube protein [Chromobacterium subtsugae]
MAALPRTLRKFNLFNDGMSFIAECLSVKLPALKMKTEDYSGAGMIGPVALLRGVEKLELEHTYNGPIPEIIATFGADKHDAAKLRWMGSYANEATGESHAVEIVAAGRHNDLDPGDAKAGENGEFKVKTDLTYLKWIMDGKELIEIDIVNDVFKVAGQDRMAQHRANVGL